MRFELRAKEVFLLSAIFSILVTAFGVSLVYLIFLYPSGDQNIQNNTNTSLSSNIAASGAITNTGNTSLLGVQSDIVRITKGVSPSVVSIIISRDVPVYKSDPWWFFYEPSGVSKKQAVGGGTWFFITKDGYILTNRHVVSDPSAEYSIILSDGTELIGKIIWVDNTNDVAIIRAMLADGKTPYTGAQPVEFVWKIADIEVGNMVIAIGNALAQFQNTVTFGLVSGLGRSIEAGDRSSGQSEQLTGLIQTDAAINPGNSWGPLISISGKVIGMNTAVTQGANGLGFAIPLSEKVVQGALDSAIKYGSIKHAFLGIRYIMLDRATAKQLGAAVENGAYVSTSDKSPAVVSGSPANTAGIEAGDTITEINGIPLTPKYSVRDALAENAPGDKVSFKIRKKTGNTEMKTIELGRSE